MEMDISPHAITDLGTHLPMKADLQSTTTRLHMLLLGIFQVLEVDCNSSAVTKEDLQEGIKLVLEIKNMGIELEKNLQEKCESSEGTTSKVEALQLEIASLKGDLDLITLENRFLQQFLTGREDKLKAALAENERLLSSMENLQMELKVMRSKVEEASRETSENPGYAARNSTVSLPQNDKLLTPEEEEILMWGTMKKDLQALKELNATDKGLSQIMKFLLSRHSMLIERNALLEAALNVSELSNSVSNAELQKSRQVNHDVTLFVQQMKDAISAKINEKNYTALVVQVCTRVFRSSIAYRLRQLNHAIGEHNDFMRNSLSWSFRTYRISDLDTLRRVQRGKLKDKALLAASKDGDALAVHTLLKYKVDPKKCDEQKWTPLQLTALNGHIAVAKTLIQYGHIVDVDRQVDGCMTPTPLHLAALKGYTKIAEMLLDLGADINRVTRDGSTPLHLAAQKGKDGMVGLLVARGASVTRRNYRGDAPLDVAIHNRHHNVETLLRSAGRA